jgi:hypothetical protein
MGNMSDLFRPNGRFNYPAGMLLGYNGLTSPARSGAGTGEP